MHNYELLQEALHEIEEGHDDYAAKLMGFSLERNHLIHILALILPYFFLPKNSISTNLQDKDITIQEATSGTNLLVSHLNSL